MSQQHGPQPQAPLPLGEEIRRCYAIATHVAKASEAWLLPALRCWPTIGTHAAGAHAAAGVLVMTLVISEHDGPAKATLFFYAALAAHAASRLAGFLWRHPEESSVYDGYPIVLLLRRKLTGAVDGEWTELVAKGVVEPALLLLAAAGLRPHALGLCYGLNAAAAGLAFRAAAFKLSIDAQRRSMRDARAHYIVASGDRRPLATQGAAYLPRGDAPGRKLARLVLAACAIALFYIAYTGQLGYQVAGLLGR